MSFNGSGGDDQSEDGELRHSPSDVKTKEEDLDFSLSEDDQDTADSLDIKPPQASRVTQPTTSTSRAKRRERVREGRSRHNRPERHRDERHGHREKRHREHTNREREIKYEREYREKEHFRDVYREKEVYGGKAENYREVKYNAEMYRREHEGGSRDMRPGYENREKRPDKYSDKERYELEKQRKYEERQERRNKSYADQALDDLRERLLDKRRIKETSDEYKYEKESRRKAKEVEIEDPETYVREIIDLSATNDEIKEQKRERHHHHRREKEPEREVVKEEDEKEEKRILTDAEREEQEQRKEKLLEAERQIARQKEQYLLDRERRHKLRQERQEAKRKLLLEQQTSAKRQRMTGELDQYKTKDLSIVTVSDQSSETSSDEQVEKSDESDRSDSESSKSRESERGSRQGSDEEYKGSPMSVGRLEKSRSRSRSHSMSRSRSQSRERSRSRERDSKSRSRSKSASPTTNGQTKPKSKSPTPPKKTIDADLPPYFPAIQGCRSVEEFQCLNRIEEGTYGVVYRARDKRTDEIVALKRLKMEKEKEGFPITSLREINTLLKGQHPNIVTVREIVVGSNMDKIFIVMDYVEHDLKSLMETMRHKKQVFVPGEVKCLLKQLLGAVAHLHDNWILHRDLKTSNLLLSHKGILKVGDFGLAREYGSPLKAYTPIVVTLWYRAPELLLCYKEYSTPIDLWSVGCIFAELLLMNALFPGKSEVDQLNRIFKDLGTPNEKIWPGYNELPAVKKMKFTEYPVSNLRNRFHMLSELGQNLLQRFLTYDPAQRVTAEDALKHPFFTEVPLPIDPAMFPTWPAKSELGHRKALAASPKPPSGGREYKQLGDGDEDSALGFHMGSTSAASMMETRRLAMGPGFSLKF